MKLSIIIVTWNTAKITQKCIRSINKYLDNPEIILVDNASSDNTISLLQKERNVVIVKNSSNLGFAKGNNVGLSHASYENILFMNSDIELIDTSLLRLIEYFNKHSNIAITGPALLNPDMTPQASVFPPQTILNAFKEFWFNQKNSYSKHLPESKLPVKVWGISGGCLLINKSFFQSIGNWNEKYFFYFEDMDLCRKVNKIGKDVYYYPQAKVIHHHGASGQKLASYNNQWRRLIPSSKKYHGLISHYLITAIIWSSQKLLAIKKYFATKNQD